MKDMPLKKKVCFFAAAFITVGCLCGIGYSRNETMAKDVSTRTDEKNIDDLEKDIEENQEEYEKIQKKIDDLRNSKDNLRDYVVNLNKSYDEIQSLMDNLEKDIEQKKSEIEAADKDIGRLEEDINNRYDSMKKRIQYMYESDSLDYFSAITSGQSITYVLNKTEYISQMLKYDRDKLNELKNLLAESDEKRNQLNSQYEALNQLMEQKDAQSRELSEIMNEAAENISEHETQIKSAEEAALAIEQEIEKKKNSVEELKKEEERRRLEASQKDTGTKTPYQELDGDLRRLAAIVYCEARGESYEGQLAVATVVMNRVENSRFPNTIEEVISQKGQFSPYASGRYAIALSMANMQQSCIDAATEVIKNGKRTGPWLYFRLKNDIIQGTIIDNQVFY